ncbi:MAG: hypothetical protein AAB676_16610 [Verrucomicrobiota bacterium]
MREELQHAQQNLEKVPRALKRFIASLSSLAPIKKFVENFRCPDGYFRDANGKDQAGTRNYLSMHESAPGFGT